MNIEQIKNEVMEIISLASEGQYRDSHGRRYFFRNEAKDKVIFREVNEYFEKLIHERGWNDNKPPLGPLPKFLHDEARIKHLEEAIERFKRAEKFVPEIVMKEYQELIASIDNTKAEFDAAARGRKLSFAPITTRMQAIEARLKIHDEGPDDFRVCCHLLSDVAHEMIEQSKKKEGK